MKKIFTGILVLAAFLFFSDTFAQHKIDFAFKVRYKKTFSYGGFAWMTTTADSGSFNEGQEYIVPPFTMPSEASVLQPAYDAIVGSVFKIDGGALNDDLFIDIILDSLDLNTGQYFRVFSDTLFIDLKIDVFVNGQPYPGHYFFNSGKYVSYAIPKTSAFLNFISGLGMVATDLGFAYIGPEGWVPEGIITENTADTIKFKAVHLSKFGGGRGHIASTNGVGLENLNGIPSKYALEQNYPNPFNPTTVIKYSIPKAGNVELKVYNVLGSEVATLVSQHQDAGNYKVTFNANNLSSGIYFYSLKANKILITKKMMLVK
jgi:hypothetical protein